MGRTRKGHNKGNLISGAPAADGQEEATLLEAGLTGPQANMSIFQRVRFSSINFTIFLALTPSAMRRREQTSPATRDSILLYFVSFFLQRSL
jgi:hypothetical protein